MRPRRLPYPLSRARRSTLGWGALTLVLSLVAGGRTWALLDRAGEAAAPYGDAVAVVVARVPVGVGEVVGPAALTRRRVPAALVPRGARPAGVAAAAGRVALAPLAPGEVVLEADLGSSLVPAGWRGVAVAPPPSGTHPRVAPGDLVEVVDVGAAGGPAVAGVVVAVDVGTAAVTVAVPGGDAAQVAHAAAAGDALLTVIATRPPR